MRRNLNADFSKAPHIKKQRSIMPINTGRATTANAGDLVPFFWTEVLAGGTYEMSTSFVARMTPSVHPTMSTAYIDWYYFFCPARILWDDWKHFFGEPEGYWTPTQTYTVPQIKWPSGGFSVGSVADHLGLPVQTTYTSGGSTVIANYGSAASGDMDSVSILPILSYCHVYNEWFRSENLQSPLYCPTSTSALQNLTGWTVGSSAEQTSPLEGPLHGASLVKACKPFDVFTAALPSPQRGPEVSIPLTSTGTFPVITGNIHSMPAGSPPMYFADTVPESQAAVMYVTGNSDHDAYMVYDGDFTSWQDLEDVVAAPTLVKPTNLYANASSATAATLNDLRYAFSIQHLYEDLARHGSRYRSILHGIFGVNDPDPTKDIPEYLGGGRAEVGMSTIIQSGGRIGNDYLGNTAGYSHTSGSNKSYVKSFTEPGIIIGCFVIRQPKQYAQGLNRMWLRKDRFDYYWPELANLGEVSIPKGTLFLDNDGHNMDTFGYQEAWYEYRQIPYEVSGLFRPGVANSLASWNYADFYKSRPTLSDEWIADNSQENIDRTLTTPSATAKCQFIVDIALKGTHVLPMPVYSIPGLTRM